MHEYSWFSIYLLYLLVMMMLAYIFRSQLGRTKVFLRAGQIGVLDSRRSEVLDSASKRIQQQFRTFIARKVFVSTRAASCVLQAYCRGTRCLLITTSYCWLTL